MPCRVVVRWERPLPRLRKARDEVPRSVRTVDQENVSATLTVAVPAARVFAVLANPAAHAVPQFIREYLHFPPFGPEHLSNSLQHLAELAAPTSRA